MSVRAKLAEDEFCLTGLDYLCGDREKRVGF